ncbi:hypothetical protein [Erythrobacter sp. AP23]|uniref:hypothetical protein n=1 Tax=Erythrobacteraceae TaxID=335929 RepID=UPI00076DBD83|nr:hypothetical protein [Erythrobacter sp. AP23]KWV94955.1 hypothetical protein ASS64_07130 [Erythrobacter sp. AP23]
MTRPVKSQGKARFVPAALAAAGLALTIPAAGLAVVQTSAAAELPETVSYLPFTPAKVDTQLAARVAALIGEDGLRFTPASKSALNKDRSVTVAVRVNDATARAISVRSAVDSVGTANSGERILAISPTSYNLGVARGYQSFAQPTRQTNVSIGLRDMGMPDLSTFAPDTDEKPEKPGRFGSRLSLENEDRAGRSPRTFEGSGNQSVDLSTSYRVVGSLNLTAGVRLSKDNNRLAPLTDGVEDDQAVYVGTRVSF